MRTILCYGDSNTWGAVPGIDTGRYGIDLRWPRLMSDQLGSDFDVFEAGLNGRTTVFDRLPRTYRSGRELIVSTMETCAPLDLVVILLGTNDVSLPFLSVADITRGAGELVTVVRASEEFGPTPGLSPTPLLIAPHIVGPLGPEDAMVSPGAVERSRELPAAYQEMSVRLGCDFLDLSPVVEASPQDPWHWEPEGHRAAAQAIAEKIRQLLPSR